MKNYKYLNKSLNTCTLLGTKFLWQYNRNENERNNMMRYRISWQKKGIAKIVLIEQNFFKTINTFSY